MRTQPWKPTPFYVYAVLCLLLIGWSTWRMATYPEVGSQWSVIDDIVSNVEPGGPSDGKLQPGDRILSIDGVPLGQAHGVVAGWRAGDRATFLVERGGTREQVEVTLAPARSLLPRLAPLAIALAFWVLGVAVLVFTPGATAPDSARGAQPALLYAFCQTVAAALASGATSSNSGMGLNVLFAVLMWWSGALAVTFHLYFPVPTPTAGARRMVLTVSALALAGSVAESAAHLLGPVSTLAFFFMLRRLWLALCFAIAVALLLLAYRRAASPERRRQVGLVALGGGLALAPFLAFSLLPDALLRQPLLPYSISFLFLLLIPLAYGYAVWHYRLVRLDRYVSRTAAYVFVVVLLAGLYLALVALLNWALPTGARQQPIVNLALVLALALAAHPLYRRLQALVSRLLYGGWYDYRTAVSQIGRSLGQAGDGTLLAENLCRGIHSALQLRCACLLLRDEKCGDLRLAAAAGDCACAQSGLCLYESGRVLSGYLEGLTTPVTTETLRRALPGSRIQAMNKGGSAGTHHPLDCEQVRLWVPIQAHRGFVGALLLGPQRGGDGPEGIDLDILGVAAQQAGVALENVRLLAELRLAVQDGERLHRQTLQARDEERKRLARDLHDQVIQSLVGLNYGLAELRADLGAGAAAPTGRLQDEVRELLRTLRGMCADLRPPTLDTLGLTSALRARLRELKNASSLGIQLIVKGDTEQELPELVSLCLFSVLQEALANVQRHAAATSVSVDLCIASDLVSLSIADNGRGFTVPERLGELTEDLHFGLVGMQERLGLLGGSLQVLSSPGQGCQLIIQVPFAPGVIEPAGSHGGGVSS